MGHVIQFNFQCCRVFLIPWLEKFYTDSRKINLSFAEILLLIYDQL